MEKIIKTYEELVIEYADMVTRICVVRLGNMDDAQDCFQNTFLKFFKKYPDFNDEQHIKSWLITVAINECRDFAKSYWNRNKVSIDEITELAGEIKEDGVIMHVMQLAPKYRDVIYLHYYEGYSVSEIATMLKSNENTVKTRLSRGREQLKVSIGGIEHE